MACFRLCNGQATLRSRDSGLTYPSVVRPSLRFYFPVPPRHPGYSKTSGRSIVIRYTKPTPIEGPERKHLGRFGSGVSWTRSRRFNVLRGEHHHGTNFLLFFLAFADDSSPVRCTDSSPRPSRLWAYIRETDVTKRQMSHLSKFISSRLTMVFEGTRFDSLGGWRMKARGGK